MSNSKLVSIVVPVYNASEHLVECVDSIAAQSYSNMEIILIDDGSTDSSFRICKKLANEDARIKVFHQKNKGVSAARNRGIAKSRGDYLVFVDSDDVIDKEFVEVLLGSCVSQGCAVSCVGVTRELASDNEIDISKSDCMAVRDFVEGLFYGDSVHGWGAAGKMFDRHMLEKAKVNFRETTRIGEDLIFVIDVLAHAKKVGVNDALLYGYRVNPSGAMHRNVNSRMFELIDSSEYAVGSVVGSAVSEGARTSLLFMNAMYCAALTYEKRKEFQNGYNRCMEIIKENRMKILRDSRTRRNLKIKATLSIVGGMCIVSRLTR